MKDIEVERSIARECFYDALSRVQRAHRDWLDLEQDASAESHERQGALSYYEFAQRRFGEQWQNLVVLLEKDPRFLADVRQAAPPRDTFILFRRDDSAYGRYWEMRSGDSYEDYLGSDEALWSVVNILMDKGRGYLRTHAEHEAISKTSVLQAPVPLEPWQRLLAVPDMDSTNGV